MRLATLSFSAILAAACVVDDRAAERDRASNDRLVEQADTLCESACAHLDACASDCTCEPGTQNAEGEPCECPEPPAPDCADQCSTWFSDLTEYGQACAETAFSYLECVTRVQACGALDALDDCGQEPIFDPVCGGTVKCQSGGAQRTATRGDSSSEPVRFTSCAYELHECSDEREYAVYCTEQGGSLGCVCQRDGKSGASFEPGDLECNYTEEQLGELCGWDALVP